MSERITKQNLSERLHNVNHRMAVRGSRWTYGIQYANGRVGLVRMQAIGGGSGIHSDVRYGTKSEIGEFLHAMMVALDDAAEKVSAVVVDP